MDDDGATAAEFLWEQIAGSLDPVELHEVDRVCLLYTSPSPRDS